MSEIGDEPELVGDDSISQLVAEVEERIRAAERETDAVRVRAAFWRTKFQDAKAINETQKEVIKADCFLAGLGCGVFFTLAFVLLIFMANRL